VLFRGEKDVPLPPSLESMRGRAREQAGSSPPFVITSRVQLPFVITVLPLLLLHLPFPLLLHLPFYLQLHLQQMTINVLMMLLFSSMERRAKLANGLEKNNFESTNGVQRVQLKTRVRKRVESAQLQSHLCSLPLHHLQLPQLHLRLDLLPLARPARTPIMEQCGIPRSMTIGRLIPQLFILPSVRPKVRAWAFATTTPTFVICLLRKETVTGLAEAVRIRSEKSAKNGGLAFASSTGAPKPVDRELASARVSKEDPIHP
jgi:hypothetical protein